MDIKTTCKESLALPRPDLANLSHATPLSRAAEGDSSDGDPPTNMPNYTVRTDGMKVPQGFYYYILTLKKAKETKEGWLYINY